MKLLIITDHYKRISKTGGGDVIAQTLVDGLFFKGYQILLFCCKGKSYDVVKESHIKRVITSITDLKKLNPPKLFYELLKEQIELSSIINKFGPDLLFFLQNGRISTPTFSFLNSLPIPKVFRIGGMWYRLSDPESDRCPWVHFVKTTKNPLLKYGIRFLKHLKKDVVNFYKFNQINADRIIVNSNDLSSRVTIMLNSKVKINVIRNGIDTSLFKFKPHIITKPVRLLYVGGLKKSKGVDILVDTLDYLKMQYPDNKLFLNIVGWTSSSRTVNELKHMIRDKELENTVNLLGHIEHHKLARIYDDHDVFVFPTSNRRIEGCPSVILEAMACGLPVVANLGPGTNELLKDKKTCIEANDDPKDLGEAIMKLISNKDLYRKIQYNAYSKVLRNHTIDNMISSFDDIFKELIELKEDPPLDY